MNILNDKKLVHLGLILDGNRRWAKENNLPTLKGHQKGYANLKKIVKQAAEKDIKFISAFIFSKENWDRSKEEVNYLMDLALKIAKKDIKELHKSGIKVEFLGSKEKLSNKLKTAIKDSEKLTKNNEKATLGLCFNYGGKQEIIDGVNNFIESKTVNEKITEYDLEQNMYSKDFPDIDLLIRTSGENRLSGFMLWKSAYAEILFVKKYWPDFTTLDLTKAINEYYKRKRRFGR